MIHIFNTYDNLSGYAAETIYTTGKKAIQQQDTFHFVLSGGNTPQGVYEKLASESRTDREFWSKTHVYWGDERCVPPDDPQSNYRMANRALLFQVPIPFANIHRIEAEHSDTQKMIEEYESLFPKSPDLVLLGMGADGHTASLFPGSPALERTGQSFIKTEAAVEPKYRITMTPEAIRNAKEVIVLVSCKDKSETLVRVFQKEGSVSKTPARLARDRTWLVDIKAAEIISGLDYLEKEIRFHK
jgi:6-phosphogluconolactonase